MAGFQSIQPFAEPPAQVDQVGQQASRPNSPWLDAAEAVTYLRLGSRRALTRAMDGQRLPYHRLGRQLRFYIPELDAWLLATGSGPQKASA